MKIAIVGSGFTGLTAAYYLKQKGCDVTVYESGDQVGGLAAGFSVPEWKWSLEHHYHHIFTGDSEIIGFAKELGLEKQIIVKETNSSVLYKKQFCRLDSPKALLTFSGLSLISRLRTAVGIAFLRFNPFWKMFDGLTAYGYIQTVMGNESWRVLWKALFEGKFGKYAKKVNASWFWSRLRVRSQKLAYFEGGFGNFLKQIQSKLEDMEIKILLSTPVSKIAKEKDKIVVTTKLGEEKFDRVLVTSSSDILLKLADFKSNYVNQLQSLITTGAQTLVLELKKPFFANSLYWLNINEEKYPFLAVVEHTNFMDPKFYNNKHLLYVGRYIEPSNPQFAWEKEKLLNLYHPYLLKLSPDYKKSVLRTWVFKSTVAQPIVFPGHSKHVPQIKTPIEGLYWASMQHIYPWDRGTNYAVGLGKEVADKILHSSLQ